MLHVPQHEVGPLARRQHPAVAQAQGLRRMAGDTGQGLFGVGTENARGFAVADWESKVADRWGPRYASFRYARGVQWDCKKGAILLAPLLEEALCRGALWQAVRRIAGRPQTVVVTAAVFALLHMQNGGLLLELPHRFLVGLFLGWLRLHGGSVWPCMVAHAVLNTAAMLTSA